MNYENAKIKYICPKCFLIQDGVKGVFKGAYKIEYLEGEEVKNGYPTSEREQELVPL